MGCAEGQNPYAGSLRESLRYPVFYYPESGCERVDGTMTMQQNAAGVWGVPRSSILPPRLGVRGLTETGIGFFEGMTPPRGPVTIFWPM
jgi:hypothetical protein